MNCSKLSNGTYSRGAYSSVGLFGGRSHFYCPEKLPLTTSFNNTTAFYVSVQYAYQFSNRFECNLIVQTITSHFFSKVQRFYSGPPLLTTEHCSSSYCCSASTFQLYRFSAMPAKTNEHIGPLLLCRPFCLVKFR